MITAVVYVPPDLPRDGHWADLGEQYIARRGYTFIDVYRTKADIMQVLRNGTATLVVFARRSHWDPTWQVPAEFVDEETRRLPPLLPPPLPARVRERNGAINWGRERVKELIDGNGPVPRGLDPESVAAARRIARHLSHCRWR